VAGVLRGRSVLLRSVERDDVAQLHEWASDPTTWGQTSAAPWTPRPVAEAQKWFDAGERWATTDRDVPFAVEADGALAGSASLWGIDTLSRSGHLGISLGPHARGRGWGSDACRVLLEYAFLLRGLHRVQLEVLATNAAAVRAYEAAGFVHEGRRRESAWVDGEFVDELFMGVLEPEWRATR
jgi:RimJ/RimL family protein N-acetyltransferase